MKDETFIPQDYDVFAGLDVTKKNIAATLRVSKDLSGPCRCRIVWITCSIMCARFLGNRRLPSSIRLDRRDMGRTMGLRLKGLAV